MLHERKIGETQEVFFRYVIEEFPELLTATNIYFVTDEETAIVNAIKKILPNPSSCPGTAICYHIVAAQIAAICTNPFTKEPRNSKALRKKTKEPSDKCNGRKKPRTKDMDSPSKKDECFSNDEIDNAVDLTITSQNDKVRK